MGNSTTLVDGWTHNPVVGQGGKHQERADGVYVGVRIPKEMSQGESVWRVVYSGRGVETVLGSWIEIGGGLSFFVSYLHLMKSCFYDWQWGAR